MRMRCRMPGPSGTAARQTPLVALYIAPRNHRHMHRAPRRLDIHAILIRSGGNHAKLWTIRLKQYPFLMAALALPGLAQQAGLSAAGDPSENWNLFYQATAIGSDHGTFTAPY